MQKNPKTASNSKKSAKGFIRVEFENNQFVAYDNQTEEQEQQGCLKEIFRDGKIVFETNLSSIRKLAQSSV